MIRIARVGAEWNLTWGGTPVDPESYRSIRQRVHNAADRPADDEITREYHVSPAQYDSISAAVTRELYIRNHHRLDTVAPRAARLYKRGTPISEVAKRFKLSQYALLRRVLEQSGYTAAQLKPVFACKISPVDVLTGRDLEQFLSAERDDGESTFNNMIRGETAAASELKAVQWFKDLGIGLVTQDDLIAEQTAKHGRAVLTPDILFTDVVNINGERVHWIDYKDYVGVDVKFLMASNKKQAAKYAAEWGNGALLFSQSFVYGLKVPHAMLLSGLEMWKNNLRD